MATFLVHGMLGAGVSAAAGRAFKAPKGLRIALGVYGFILGSAPDTFAAINVWLYGSGQLKDIIAGGQLKNVLHTHAPWWLQYQPPFFLHVWLDTYFHKFPDWWSKLWWLEIAMWLASGLLLWYAYRKDAA